MFRAALHMVISDFFHLRLGASVGGGGGGGGGGVDQQHSYRLNQGVYSVCSSRPAFPTGPSVCWGKGGAQQASV